MQAAFSFLLLSLQSAHAAPQASLTRPAASVVSPTDSVQQKTLLVQMQDAFTNIAQTVEPTVVNIKAERQSSPFDSAQGGDSPVPGHPAPKGGTPFSGPGTPPHTPNRFEATGSGVIVRSDGYILTNDHVVDGAIGGQVTVTLSDGREFKGTVFPDYKSDLAIVKIDPGSASLPVAEFADASEVRPGQWAIAVGSPFDLQNTVTVGIISATGRQQYIGGETGSSGRYYPDLIQTDAAINPGNSGGPLFNIDGKVVGINVAIKSPVEGSAGVGFAIPVAIAQQVASALITQGKVTRGYLGLAPIDLTPAAQQLYRQKTGAFVEDVVLGSPAGKAGLQATDIVTSFNHKMIFNALGLREAIAAAAPGQSIPIAYVRDGSTQIATATIAAFPSPLQTSTVPVSLPKLPARISLGLTVRDLTPRDRQSLNLPADAAGVYISHVLSGGAAESASLSDGLPLEGAILEKINTTGIKNKQDFVQAANSLSEPVMTIVVLYNSPADNQLHQHALRLHF